MGSDNDLFSSHAALQLGLLWKDLKTAPEKWKGCKGESVNCRICILVYVVLLDYGMHNSKCVLCVHEFWCHLCIASWNINALSKSLHTCFFVLSWNQNGRNFSDDSYSGALLIFLVLLCFKSSFLCLTCLIFLPSFSSFDLV